MKSSSRKTKKHRKLAHQHDAAEQVGDLVFDTLSSHICILDETGMILAVNQAWRDFAVANQVNPDSVSEGVNYLTVCESASETDAEQARAMASGIRKVINGELNDFTMEYTCHSPIEQRWFVAKVYSQKKEDHIRVVISHRNMTEIKQMEHRYREFLESAPDGMLVIDREGKIELVNQAIVELFGYTRNELIGQPVEKLVPKVFRDIHVKHRHGFTEAPHRRQMGANLDLMAERKDGSVFPVGISLNTVRTIDDEILVIAAVRDISDRKRIEQALKASEERYRHIVQNVDEIIYSVKASPDNLFSGEVDYVNDKVWETTGCQPDEFVINSNLWFSLIHPEDIPGLEATTRVAYEQKQSVTREYRIRHNRTNNSPYAAKQTGLSSRSLA